MTGMHFSDDELLDLFYCGTADGGHIQTCEACRTRYEALVVRRKQVLAVEPEPALGMLAGQRAVIYSRIGRREIGSWPRALLAGCGATALAVGFLLYAPPGKVTIRPAVEQGVPVASVSDNDLFRDIADTIGTPEPRAAAPIRSLFEEKR